MREVLLSRTVMLLSTTSQPDSPEEANIAMKIIKRVRCPTCSKHVGITINGFYVRHNKDGQMCPTSSRYVGNPNNSK